MRHPLHLIRRAPASRALALAAVLASPATSVAGGHEEVRRMAVESMSVDVTAIENPAFPGVFGRQLYDVTYTRFADNERFSPASTYRVYRAGGRLVPVFDPGSKTELGYFDELIAPDFRLTRETAPDFMAALKALMPERFFDEVEGDAVRRVEGRWQFLNGTFFDDVKGFVVSVDGEGRITGVAYDLKLAPEG